MNLPAAVPTVTRLARGAFVASGCNLDGLAEISDAEFEQSIEF
jgi:hypothetical protein